MGTSTPCFRYPPSVGQFALDVLRELRASAHHAAANKLLGVVLKALAVTEATRPERKLLREKLENEVAILRAKVADLDQRPKTKAKSSLDKRRISAGSQ